MVYSLDSCRAARATDEDLGLSPAGGRSRRHRGLLFHLYRGSELLQDNRVHEAKEELEQALRSSSRATPRARIFSRSSTSGSGSIPAPSRSTKSYARLPARRRARAEPVALLFEDGAARAGAHAARSARHDAARSLCARGRTSASFTSGSATTKRRAPRSNVVSRAAWRAAWRTCSPRRLPRSFRYTRTCVGQDDGISRARARVLADRASSGPSHPRFRPRGPASHSNAASSLPSSAAAAAHLGAPALVRRANPGSAAPSFALRGTSNSDCQPRPANRFLLFQTRFRAAPARCAAAQRDRDRDAPPDSAAPSNGFHSVPPLAANDAIPTRPEPVSLAAPPAPQFPRSLLRLSRESLFRFPADPVVKDASGLLLGTRRGELRHAPQRVHIMSSEPQGFAHAAAREGPQSHPR